MFNITFNIEKIKDSYFLGWLEINGNIIKGLVADGENESIVEKNLLRLFGAKISYDYGRQMRNNGLNSNEPKYDHGRPVMTRKTKVDLVPCE